MAAELTYNAVLADRIDLTDLLSIMRVRFENPLDSQSYLPGQYTSIGLNNRENPQLGGVKRAMSLASCCEQDPDYEFYIRLVTRPVSKNPLTPLLWDLKVGEPLFCRPKCVGRFTFEHTIGEQDTRHRILVAAGTGLAPFLSQVRAEVHKNPSADLSKFVILHAASYVEDLGYRRELKRLSRNNGLHYYPSISRPTECPDWTADTGRVEHFFSADKLPVLAERLGLRDGAFRPENCVVYICGLQGTIEKTISGLLPLGFVPENRKLRKVFSYKESTESSIFYEQYDEQPYSGTDRDEVIQTLKANIPRQLLCA